MTIRTGLGASDVHAATGRRLTQLQFTNGWPNRTAYTATVAGSGRHSCRKAVGIAAGRTCCQRQGARTSKAFKQGSPSLALRPEGLKRHRQFRPAASHGAIRRRPCLHVVGLRSLFPAAPAMLFGHLLPSSQVFDSGGGLLREQLGLGVLARVQRASALEPRATGQFLLRLKVDGSSGCPMSLSLARKPSLSAPAGRGPMALMLWLEWVI
ncbi:hypothetical protein COO60DRAFT_92293 [Scenedesmus sp. NREL 46B-D3]|nr:hypothetical protein COO60DRAFT_92293 [Scenedesmus sp. NREL 46B-D3]